MSISEFKLYIQWESNLHQQPEKTCLAAPDGNLRVSGIAGSDGVT